MAAIAASLMWRGVAKWGSPAPKSTSLAPWARSLAASAVTAMVAETSMRPMRSAKSLVAVVAVMVSLFFQIFAARCREMEEFAITVKFQFKRMGRDYIKQLKLIVEVRAEARQWQYHLRRWFIPFCIWQPERLARK